MSCAQSVIEITLGNKIFHYCEIDQLFRAKEKQFTELFKSPTVRAEKVTDELKKVKCGSCKKKCTGTCAISSIHVPEVPFLVFCSVECFFKLVSNTNANAIRTFVRKKCTNKQQSNSIVDDASSDEENNNDDEERNSPTDAPADGVFAQCFSDDSD